MFQWCQTVNVFNIENHYHFYSERTTNPPKAPQIPFEKLKANPISLSTSANLGRSSRSCFKKGLNLSTKLAKQQNPQPTSPHETRYNQSHQQKISAQNQLNPTLRSQVDMSKTKSIQSQVNLKQILKPSINPIRNIQQTKKQNQFKLYLANTNTLINNKPATPDNKNKHRQQNNLLLTQLYASHKIYKSNCITAANYAHTYINANNNNNNNTNSNTHTYTHTHTHTNTNISINRLNNNIADTIPIRSSNKDQLLDISTSRNIGSRQRSQRQRQRQISKSSYMSRRSSQSQIQRYKIDSLIQDSLNISSNRGGFNNSKYNYNTSKSLSASVNYSTGNNQGYCLRVMQASKGQARQASIILSNILSRGSQNCYSSTHNPIRPKQKTFNFQDKLTILSQQNDVVSQSQSQLKIQQSELCDMDPRSNFIIIQNKAIVSSIYRVDLAVEIQTHCIVSLKQIGFREMKIISQQLQMYEFIDQRLANAECSRHILQLYQFQTTSSSYILIKQPYTQTLTSYYQSLPTLQSRNHFITNFQIILNSMLHEFAKQGMHACRQLSKLDFVACDSVIKLHDVSIFKQMKKQIYPIQQLMKITLFSKQYEKDSI